MSIFRRFEIHPGVGEAIAYSVFAGAIGGGLIGCVSLVAQWVHTGGPGFSLFAIAPLVLYFIIGFVSGVVTCGPIIFQGILLYLFLLRFRLSLTVRIMIVVTEAAIVSFLVAYFLVFKVLWASIVLGAGGALGVFVGLIMLRGKYWNGVSR